MKKILLASTALVLSAGLAHAQAVTITGSGRMGIVGSDTGPGWTWSQEHRLDLNFNVSVEADHGLTFGAWTRARMEGGWANNAIVSGNARGVGGFSASRVWVEANGLRLTFGNIDGAVFRAGVAMGYGGGCDVGYVGGHLCGDSIGLPGVSQIQNSRAFTGAGTLQNPAVTGRHRTSLEYNWGSSRVTLSHDRDMNTTELGARTTFNAFTVAVGLIDNADNDWTLSGRYNGGSWSVGAIIGNVANNDNWALSGTVALGGGSLYGYVGEVANKDAYGLSYGYGLGGGATLTAGWETVDNTDTASIGVAFNF